MLVFTCDNIAGDDQVSVNSFKKYFISRVKFENYNIEIDGRNFYDQPIMTRLSNTTKSEK